MRLKCPKCGLALRTLETRHTDRWVRRTKMCTNLHKTVTHQIHGQWEEKIVRVRHFERRAKPVTSLPSPSLSVASILRGWVVQEAQTPAYTSSE